MRLSGHIWAVATASGSTVPLCPWRGASLSFQLHASPRLQLRSPDPTRTPAAPSSSDFWRPEGQENLPTQGTSKTPSAAKGWLGICVEGTSLEGPGDQEPCDGQAVTQHCHARVSRLLMAFQGPFAEAGADCVKRGPGRWEGGSGWAVRCPALPPLWDFPVGLWGMPGRACGRRGLFSVRMHLECVCGSVHTRLRVHVYECDTRAGSLPGSAPAGRWGPALCMCLVCAHTFGCGCV